MRAEPDNGDIDDRKLAFSYLSLLEDSGRIPILGIGRCLAVLWKGYLNSMWRKVTEAVLVWNFSILQLAHFLLFHFIRSHITYTKPT